VHPDALPGLVRQSRLHQGQTQPASVIRPTVAAPPSAKQPELALVSVRRQGTPGAAAGPTWVFPFDRPAPPGPGGNQSLALNTTDGATRLRRGAPRQVANAACCSSTRPVIHLRITAVRRDARY
jgi:hypothetical protein